MIHIDEQLMSITPSVDPNKLNMSNSMFCRLFDNNINLAFLSRLWYLEFLESLTLFFSFRRTDIKSNA